MTANSAALSLQNVSVSFGDVTVLHDISLEVERGHSVVVIGPSGSGKTVLLKTIIGLNKPSSGSLQVDPGLKMGMLFQKSGLFDSLPNWENIAFRLLQEGGLSRKAARERAIEKLALVGLQAREADLYPNDLSGGMQKRVGIARAIADDPDFLLLDEPTAGLDPITSNLINDMILDLVEETGVTVVSVNSDMVGAKKTAFDAVMLYEGRIIWHGPTETMMDSGNGHVDQFVHSRAEGPIPVIS
ncbi:MAG: ABC transporter ATP-binding protein [Magnetovibrionaceae bacterium]